MTSAMRLISYRERSVHELTDRLIKKGFGSDETAAVVSQLKDAGYLDDERFARTLADSRVRNKYWGRSRIAADLGKKGVPRDIIDLVLGEIGADVEADVAEKALQRWLRRSGVTRPLDERGFARAFRHLSSKGFSAAVIMGLLKGQKGEEYYYG